MVPRRRTSPRTRRALPFQVREDLVIALANHSPLYAVRGIVTRCPQVLHEKDRRSGRCPLFDAVRLGSDLNVVQFLVGQHPPALLEHDSNGRNLIRFAMENSASDDIIRYLFDVTPQAVSLHDAFRYGASDEIVLELLDRCPEARQEKDQSGSLPAHVAASRGSSLQVMRAIVEPYPQALREKDGSKYLPVERALTVKSFHDRPTPRPDVDGSSRIDGVARYLHDKFPDPLGDEREESSQRAFRLAVGAGAPPEILSFLLELRPQALRERNSSGDLPIHRAAELRTPGGFAAFQFLVKSWPESIELPGRHGNRALHLALLSYVFEPLDEIEDVLPLAERVQYILDQWPPAIGMAGYSEQIPLHLAIFRGVPVGVLDVLLDAWPNSIHASAKDGSSLLDVASQPQRVSIETVEFLVGRDESILDARSAKDGSLPVHIFAGEESCNINWDGESLDFVSFLVERRPESVMARDNKGCLPIHRAVANPDQWLNVVEYLVEQRPETLAEKNHRGSSPLHVAVAACTQWLEHVEFLVAQRPEALQEGDNDGNLPIHIAVSVKRTRPELIRFLAEQNPDSLLERNNLGLSPLHLVVVHAVPDLPSVEVSRILVEHRPDVVTLGNFKDVLPVHLAAHRGDSCLDLVRFFVEERPDTVMAPSQDGWLPLHCATASAHGAFEVAECLVERGPDAVMVATSDLTRRLPLHCALAGSCSLSDVAICGGNAGRVGGDDDDDNNNNYEERETRLLELVRLLVDKAPASLQVQDAHGMIPLAVAALNSTTPLDVLFLLTTSWPGFVSTMVGMPFAAVRSRPPTKRRRRAHDDAAAAAAAAAAAR